MQHGLKEIIKALAAGSLACLQLADFCYPISELLLERHRWHQERQFPRSVPLPNVRRLMFCCLYSQTYRYGSRQGKEQGRGAVAICVGIEVGAISSVTRLPHQAARSMI
jgi:hypothetical protein